MLGDRFAQARQVEHTDVSILSYRPPAFPIRTGVAPACFTCVTCKRAKRFQTPLGRFTYRPVNESAFSYGVALQSVAGGSFFLAEPEKALCDRIACIRHLTAMRDVPAALDDHLRVDLDAVVRMRLNVVRHIAKRYRRRNVDAFLRWLQRHGTSTE